jgi:hypothetical protein
VNERTILQPQKSASPVNVSAHTGLLQRKCACGGGAGLSGQCAECDKNRLPVQRKPANHAWPSTAPPIVHDVLRAQGQPLDSSTRALFESRFRHDFSKVRVHTGDRAAESARAVNALAYTVGQNVVFGSGRYDPASADGQRLLAHELTHVVQQHNVSPTSQPESLVIGPQNDHLEAEANRAEATSAVRSQAPTGAGVLQRQTTQPQPQTSFEGCDQASQNDLRAKHQPALDHVNRAIASLAPGWTRMDPAHKSAFRQYFDPANSGDIDDGFVRDVRGNFQRIRGYMGSLRFDCDPNSWTVCGTSSRWCVGGRLMWTCFGNLHVCTNTYPSASDPFTIETMIHESVHNALMTTDRAYSNRPEFNQLRPRGGGFFGRVLNFLSNVPVLGLLFRNLPGNNDTINNPDSYAGYAMQV